MFNIDDKVTLVTGSSKGIGKAIADAFVVVSLHIENIFNF